MEFGNYTESVENRVYALFDTVRDRRAIPSVMQAVLEIIAYRKIANRLNADQANQGGLLFYEIIKKQENILGFIESQLQSIFLNDSQVLSAISLGKSALCQMEREGLTAFMRVLDRIPDDVATYQVLLEMATSHLADLGSLQIPGEVERLMVDLGGIQPGASVYCPFSSLGLAHAAAARGAAVFAEQPVSMKALATWLSVLFDHDVRNAYGDPIQSPSWKDPLGSLRRFDITLSATPLEPKCNYNIASDIFNRFPEKTRVPNILYIRHILAQTTRRAVVIVPNGFLFRTTSAEAAFKQEMLRNRWISAVIALPPGLLTSTSVAFSILVLDMSSAHSKVLFINASDERFFMPRQRRGALGSSRNRLCHVEELLELFRERKDSDYSRVVDHEEIYANRWNLQAERFALVGEQRRVFSYLAEMQTRPLETVATVINQAPLEKFARALNPATDPAMVDVGIEVREVTLGDLGDDGYVMLPKSLIRLDARAKPYLQDSILRPGDLLLTVKGMVGRVALVREYAGSAWIPNQSFHIIRLNESANITPVILLRFFESETGRALLESRAGGSTVRMLQIKDIKDMPVPVLLEEEQRRVCALDADIVESYKKIRSIEEEIASKRKSLWGLQDIA